MNWPTADPLPCEICGDARATEPHHLLHKSQGGDDHDHNLLTVCRRDHDAIHRLGYRVERTRSLVGGQQGLPTTVSSLTLWNRQGELVLARHFRSGFNQGAHIAELQAIPNLLGYLTDEVKYLDEEGMAQAAEIVSKDTGAAGWKYLCELFQRARLMIPWGERKEKLKAIADRCGISIAQVERYALIGERIDASTLMQTPIEDISLVMVAAMSEEPAAALAQIEERKLENPGYSVRQARRDIASREAVEGGQGLARALSLLRQAYALLRDASELIGSLEASLEADQIAEVAHSIYEMAWQIGDRASPAKEQT